MRAARAPSVTSLRSSDGSSGIARPSWRRIQRAVDRPGAKLGGALLRDRALELAEAALQLQRVVGVAHLAAARGARRCRRERAGRAAECEVLQREPQRLRVREASLEQEEAGL